jgi:hypothetical protein
VLSLLVVGGIGNNPTIEGLVQERPSCICLLLRFALVQYACLSLAWDKERVRRQKRCMLSYPLLLLALLDLLYFEPYLVLSHKDELDTFEESTHPTRKIDHRKILSFFVEDLQYFQEWRRLTLNSVPASVVCALNSSISVAIIKPWPT